MASPEVVSSDVISSSMVDLCVLVSVLVEAIVVVVVTSVSLLVVDVFVVNISSSLAVVDSGNEAVAVPSASAIPGSVHVTKTFDGRSGHLLRSQGSTEQQPRNPLEPQW